MSNKSRSDKLESKSDKLDEEVVIQDLIDQLSKNEKETTRARMFNFFIFIIALLSVFSVGFHIQGLWTSMHNIDNAFNMRFYELEFDRELVDYTDTENYATTKDLYIPSFDRVFYHFYFALISAFMFGASFYVISLKD